jgi:hypothetical protein
MLARVLRLAATRVAPPPHPAQHPLRHDALDGSTDYISGPGGLPLEQINGATTYWYHHDQIGSTRAITDSADTKQASYTSTRTGT